jgi:(p)ppGpp synthase/HD superfamily hydrolase
MVDVRTEPELSFVHDLPLTRAAIEFAQSQHGEQRRAGDQAAFLLHPLEVASLLARSRYPDHEDTDAMPADLEQRFGPDVAKLVELVSDDPSIADQEERKDDVRERVRRAGGFAPVVYGADKVSKVRELRMQLATGLDREQAQVKLRRHRKSLQMLETRIPRSRVVELLRFELEALERLPPQP